MRGVIALLLLLLLSDPAHAENCETAGCVGRVFYLHVPRGQFRTPVIFQAGGLPNVNEVAALADVASLLPSSSFQPPWVVDLQKDLAVASSAGRSLPGWGIALRAGSKVKILSYQQFPQLDAQNDEVFALVLVLTDK